MRFAFVLALLLPFAGVVAQQQTHALQISVVPAFSADALPAMEGIGAHPTLQYRWQPTWRIALRAGVGYWNFRSVGSPFSIWWFTPPPGTYRHTRRSLELPIAFELDLGLRPEAAWHVWLSIGYTPGLPFNDKQVIRTDGNEWFPAIDTVQWSQDFLSPTHARLVEILIDGPAGARGRLRFGPGVRRVELGRDGWTSTFVTFRLAWMIGLQRDVAPG